MRRRVGTPGMAGIGMVSAFGPGAANGAVGGAPGWWELTGRTCLIAYDAKNAANYAASKVNLANPGTYNAIEGIAVPWAGGTGWQFAGASWLDTQFNPTAACSSMANYSNSAGFQCFPYGALDTVGAVCYHEVNSIRNGGQTRGLYAAAQRAWGFTSVTGTLGLATISVYKNGAVLLPLIAVSAWNGGIPTLYIGARNLNGVANTLSTLDIHQFVLYAETLTAPEMLTVHNRLAAL